MPPLDPLLFKDLQIAVLRQRIARQQAQALLELADQQLKKAAEAAGLDPTKDYHLDEATCTVTERPLPS